MDQIWSGWCWRLGLPSSLAISGVIASSGDCAFSQSNITPDSTLGSETSIVIPNFDGRPDEVIDGGAQRGANLFHSFVEFNVNEGRRAYFYSPNAAIQNILARVTGSHRSEILGIIGTYGRSNPNLFLINPNGIIFGPNARLDVRGSFAASTARSVIFADGTQFGAAAFQTTPLLTVSVPIGLQFRGTAGKIQNQSQTRDSFGEIVGLQVGLQVQPGKTLALVGGDVRLDGGTLKAEGGRVELGGVAGSGTVGLNVDGNNLRLSFPVEVRRADVSLTNRALVNASGEGGGNIQVQGRSVTLSKTSRIYADTRSQNGGGISIQALELIVQDGSQVSASTSGAGQGGNLVVTASDSVKLSGTTPDSKFPSGLFAQTEKTGTGNAGTLTITTGKLIVRNGAQVSVGTFSAGQGGTLIVTASDSVKLSGAVETPERQFNSGLFAQTQGTGNAGKLTIATSKLIAQDGGQVAVGAGIGSQGKGGTLTVTASDSVKLSGTAPNGQDTSGLFARTRGVGPAGDLTVATGQLIIRDKAQVTVSGLESGDAGNLEVRARSIQLDKNGTIRAETASGQGGNITLRSQELLLLRHGSNISTTAGIAGSGGNITINTPFIVAVPSENSDITANANYGKGGFIQITSQGIFGLERREQLTPLSDITAFSQQNPNLNGVVEINTLGVDPSRGLVALPAELVDVTGLIAQGCPGSGGNVGRGVSEFMITGRGGLPPSPSEALRSDAVRVDLPASTSSVGDHLGGAIATQAPRSTAMLLVEAQGWVTNANGEVALTATAPTLTPHSFWLTPNNCHVSKNSS